MTFDVVIISVSERAVQCALEDGSPAFWLPRKQVEWRGALEPGEVVSATIPRWLALKHRQLVALRTSTQKVLDLDRVEINPAIATKEGSLPMADDRQDAGKGFLARNERREKPAHPEFTGKLNIRGVEYRLAAWVREKDGRKFFSIAVNEIEQRHQMPPQRPAGGPTFRDDESIPFEMEWR